MNRFTAAVLNGIFWWDEKISHLWRPLVTACCFVTGRNAQQLARAGVYATQVGAGCYYALLAAQGLQQHRSAWYFFWTGFVAFCWVYIIPRDLRMYISALERIRKDFEAGATTIRLGLEDLQLIRLLPYITFFRSAFTVHVLVATIIGAWTVAVRSPLDFALRDIVLYTYLFCFCFTAYAASNFKGPRRSLPALAKAKAKAIGANIQEKIREAMPRPVPQPAPAYRDAHP